MGAHLSIFDIFKSLDIDTQNRVLDLTVVDGEMNLKRKLLKFFQDSDVYDRQKEQVEFDYCNLKSLRHVTRKWLLKAIGKLRGARDEMIQQISEIATAIEHGDFERAKEFLESTYSFALSRDKFHVLPSLLKLQEEIANNYFTGKARIIEDQLISARRTEALRLLSIENEFKKYKLKNYEPVRLKFLETGTWDKKKVKAFLENGDFKTSDNDLPFSVRIELNTIEEMFHHANGDSAEALNFARNSLAMFNEKKWRMNAFPNDYAKLLIRSHNHASSENNKIVARKIIGLFEKSNPEDPDQKQFLLDKYILSLFEFAYQFGEFGYADKAILIVERNEEELISQKESLNLQTISLYIGFYSLATLKIAKARHWLSHLLQTDTKRIKRKYLIEAHVLNMIQLFEERDFHGLESNGRNYLRFIKKQDQDFEASALVIVSLKKCENWVQKGSLKAELKLLEKKLELLKDGGKVENGFWYREILYWLKKTVND